MILASASINTLNATYSRVEVFVVRYCDGLSTGQYDITLKTLTKTVKQIYFVFQYQKLLGRLNLFKFAYASSSLSISTLNEHISILSHSAFYLRITRESLPLALLLNKHMYCSTYKFWTVGMLIDCIVIEINFITQVVWKVTEIVHYVHEIKC